MAKADLYPDFKEFLKSLNSAGVEYRLIGGYAVIYYGYRRMTDDLDVWIATGTANTMKVSQVLQKFAGFPADQVKPSALQEPGKVFVFGREPVRIDLLTGPSGVEFQECYKRRNPVIIDGIKVPLISFDDLKRNKIASGREKDLADLRNLPPSWPWAPQKTKSGSSRKRPRK
jgi:predicted nucleotidyltransferase